MIAVDEHGDVVDGDHVIAICAGDMRQRGALRDDTVVVTVMTNLGFHIAMREAGIHVVQTDVGDRYGSRRRSPGAIRSVASNRVT